MKFYDDTPHFYIDEVESVELVNMSETIDTIVLKINQEDKIHHVHVWKDGTTNKLRCRITFDTIELGITKIDNTK